MVSPKPVAGWCHLFSKHWRKQTWCKNYLMMVFLSACRTLCVQKVLRVRANACTGFPVVARGRRQRRHRRRRRRRQRYDGHDDDDGDKGYDDDDHNDNDDDDDHGDDDIDIDDDDNDEDDELGG